jgi:GNAT superfamily N-acetyltransferase
MALADTLSAIELALVYASAIRSFGIFHCLTEEYHMHIRTATVHDAAGIAYVHVETWRTTYRGIVPDDFLARLSYAQREQFWHQILTAPDRHTSVYVAEDEQGQVIGFASGGPERSGDPLYTGELYAIYILAHQQGQGVGRQLVTPLVHRLLQQGMQAMLLWVLAENPARKFYERLGGQLVHEKSMTIGGVPLLEVAYGWPNVRTLIEPTTR